MSIPRSLMNKKRKIILGFIITILLIALAGVGVIMSAQKNMENLDMLIINDVDLSTIEDGTYSGSYSAFPIAVEVKVMTESNKITNVELVRHRNGQGAAAEVIPNAIIAEQSLEVDLISGATYSSKAILKAIENALTSN